MKVVVVCGGLGGERPVSLSSGKRVAKALASAGVVVKKLDWQGTLPRGWLRVMKEADAVFLALHGEGGEGGVLQQQLEEAGIFHYTGSAPEGASLALNKEKAKERVAKCGINVAQGAVWEPRAPFPALAFPLVAKPLTGGSSIGLFVWQNEEERGEFLPDAPLLCEE